MSRWAHDPDAAADALIGRSLDAVDLSGRILLANPSGGLPAMLAARGVACALWQRRLQAGGSAQAWPPAGPFDLAIMRLAKAKDEQEMAAHAVLSVLGPEALLLLYGGNDEGIRSAAAMLEGLCGTGTLETIAQRGHGRVLAARRPKQLAQLRPDLGQWRRVTPLSIAGRIRPWVTYPGLFAAGLLDEGTALLLDVLPPLSAGARIADFGCGSGVIGAALPQLPGIGLDMIDHDSLALLAVRENVPAGRALLASSLSQTGGALYDAILSNPPLHQGMTESHAALKELVAEAPAHLVRGGCLRIVLQRRLPLAQLLAQHLRQVCVLADNGRYRVWHAQRG